MKKILRNLRWLFRNAPVVITEALQEESCDYCDNSKNWVHIGSNGLTICHDCLKKIADKILL